MTVRSSLLAAISLLALMVPGLQLGAAPAPVATRPATSIPTTRPRLPADQPSPSPNATRSTGTSRHDRYVAKAKQGNIDLYMLGDSITDFWGNANSDPRRVGDFENWTKNLGGWKPGCFGILGDMTQHVLWRILNGELEGVAPKVIVLLVGTNNLTQDAGYTPEQTAAGIKAILDVLREKQPQARILLMAIFPRQDYTRTHGISIMDKIDATNAFIAKYADDQHITYLNINGKFLDKDGKIQNDIMFDLLHPTPKGFQIWADAIRPILTEWLGPPVSPPATLKTP